MPLVVMAQHPFRHSPSPIYLPWRRNQPLANALRDLKRHDEAEPPYLKALDVRRAVCQPGHPYIACSLSNLASLCRKKHEFARAEPLYQQAIAIRHESLPPNHDITAALSSFRWKLPTTYVLIIGISHHNAAADLRRRPVRCTATAFRGVAVFSSASPPWTPAHIAIRPLPPSAPTNDTAHDGPRALP